MDADFPFKTMFIGKEIYQFDQLPSTNDYALELLSKNNPSEGTVISTFNQTAGKGQHGSIWESSANLNLSLSVILYPSFIAPKDQFIISQAMALAVKDFLFAFLTRPVEIKWPNDLLVDERKIAGILIQNGLVGHKISHTVTGIGINVNQQEFQFTEGRAPTSMTLETGINYNLLYLQQALFATIETRYLQLRQNKNHVIRRNYLEVMYKYQEKHRFETESGEQFEGYIQGISPSGSLLIEKEEEQLSFGVKMLKFL